LFSTISYRLEKSGRASRFPFVMRLFGGSLDPPELPAAVAELDIIARELRILPARSAMANLDRLTAFQARGECVDPKAASAFDLFLGLDGRPLVTVIQSAMTECARSGSKVTLTTPLVMRWHRKGFLWALTGVFWIGIGYVYFPRHIFMPAGLHSGPLAWPLGLIMLAGGLYALVDVPSSGRSGPRRQLDWIGLALTVASILLVVLTWRS
jgi:Immunity protein 70